LKVGNRQLIVAKGAHNGIWASSVAESLPVRGRPLEGILRAAGSLHKTAVAFEQSSHPADTYCNFSMNGLNQMKGWVMDG
jgi:hypothetical protein